MIRLWRTNTGRSIGTYPGTAALSTAMGLRVLQPDLGWSAAKLLPRPLHHDVLPQLELRRP